MNILSDVGSAVAESGSTYMPRAFHVQLGAGREYSDDLRDLAASLGAFNNATVKMGAPIVSLTPPKSLGRQ